MKVKMLKNKIVVITGSSGAIGSRIAIALAEEADVVVHYNKNKKNAEKTFNKVKKINKNSMLIKFDVSKEREVKDGFNKIFSRFKRVDILINCVGNFLFKDISETTIKEFKSIIEPNLYGTFLCSQAVLPKMRSNKYGRIINFGSAASDQLISRQKTTPYYISKSGILLLTRSMAVSEAKYGITINSISPGVVESSVADVKNLPMSRKASFADVINAIMFLLSEKSDYVSGANIEVTGAWRPK